MTETVGGKPGEAGARLSEVYFFEEALYYCSAEARSWLTNKIALDLFFGNYPRWKRMARVYVQLGKTEWTREKADQFAAYVESLVLGYYKDDLREALAKLEKLSGVI